MQAKKGEFIEIDYIAKIKSTGKIFDLTLADAAKKEGVFQQSQTYEPLIICVGEKHVIKGLDEVIEGKEIGKEFETDVPPEKAFGKRNAKLIQLVSQRMFKKQKMNPFPGLQLNIDGNIATVRSVSGGRVIIDFNNPLAGQVIHYWVKINRTVTDNKKKLQALAYSLLAERSARVEIKDKTATVTLKNKDKDLRKNFSETAKKLVPGIEIKII